jgi:hypothetical protein
MNGVTVQHCKWPIVFPAVVCLWETRPHLSSCAFSCHPLRSRMMYWQTPRMTFKVRPSQPLISLYDDSSLGRTFTFEFFNFTSPALFFTVFQTS